MANTSSVLSVLIPAELRAKAEKTAKEKGFENLSQFVRSLLRKATA